ncbi:uncharacterized protein N7483_006127 [Penicillium malachiteum]|uniref:uncharacterized protein n=1 Tax=Penicillium malachiteum TaxID=1324776 RepID=UPI00254980FE|nr:uncharacterized protein N7483_006127 [Penicillium malachiteum]KAJ5731619.1 hypothetical protein N7483_006127 [Penicillium malachiteum]
MVTSGIVDWSDEERIVLRKNLIPDSNVSLATLSMASKMVADFAKARGAETADKMPPCCFFNVRGSVEHLEERRNHYEETNSKDTECLLEFEANDMDIPVRILQIFKCWLDSMLGRVLSAN